VAGNDLHLFAKDLSKMADGLGGNVLRPAFEKVGLSAKDAATRAARGDLGGDATFSGWRKPGALQAKYTLHRNGRGVTIHRTPKSAGPWRVAEDGRNASSPYQGPSINQRTGTTSRTKSGKIAARKPGRARRYSGTTAGKGTWTKAEAAINADAPDVFETEVVAVVNKLWGG
jgi:hypothetical protein